MATSFRLGPTPFCRNKFNEDIVTAEADAPATPKGNVLESELGESVTVSIILLR